MKVSTEVLSGVAVMILVRVLLTYQRAIPTIASGFSGWDRWQVESLASVWLYLCVAALAVPLLASKSAPMRALEVASVAAAFSMASLAAWAPVAALRMRGGNLTGNPPDFFYLVGLTGKGSVGAEYTSSALLVVLASMAWLMTSIFIVRGIWTGSFPALAATAVVLAAWAPWPSVDFLLSIEVLHGIALPMSAIAGVAVARSMASERVTVERVAAGVGILAAVLAFLSDNRLIDYAPFAASAGVVLVASRLTPARRDKRPPP